MHRLVTLPCSWRSSLRQGEFSKHFCLFQLQLLLLLVCVRPTAQLPEQDATCKTGPELSASSAPPGSASSGVALLSVRWRRSLVESDEANTVEQPISAQSVRVSPEPCAKGGCANFSKANVSKDPVSIVNAKTLLHDAPTNTFASGWIGQGGGLSSTMSMMPDLFTNANVSSPPLSQEHFEPFGYPGAGLLLELQLPKISLKELHNSWRSSLAQFLFAVQTELSKAGEVNISRISILGIHGRYKRYENDALFNVQGQSLSHILGQTHVDEEVVLRFEILPGWNTDPDPSIVLASIRKEMNSSSSSLMHGSLGSYLNNATLIISPQVGMASVPLSVEHHSVVRMSAMAWPIGISAAFIGVLICVASY